MLKIHLGFKDCSSLITGCLLLPVFINGCGSGKNGVDSNNPGGSTFIVQGSGGANGGLDSGNGVAAVWPPAGYTNVTNVTYGAYALGPDISSGSVPANTATTCSGMLFGAVRDVKMGTTPGGHPDFETAPDSSPTGVQGIVASTLGADGKPVFAFPTNPLAGTHTQADFDEWYHDTPGVNMTYLVALELTTASDGTSTFSASINNPGGLADSSYFPLDNAGFGNQTQYLPQGCPNHNFSFTTEIHTSFTYNGGETFTFVGDDDVWVFINKQLVPSLDLGGRHVQLKGSVALDTLGLTKGSVYDLDVFNAERHTVQSNFRVDTTLTLANCGQVNGVIIN